ncbi:helix-turn-helix domain-containing protein [Enterobacter roggenkampii]|uniref:helix-turn-helix domain-containing protein n=1 Tax=Enterobacter roggenkampii TaxID=1812935 RepID=UPI002DBC11A4|nr:helix-turn-helix domain-containing protein [Enterobacter roggenkampii]MEB5887480.1 helix-turn-helix domain-containing protein [Enterobacter roggenkampii]
MKFNVNIAVAVETIGRHIEECNDSHFSERKKNQRIDMKKLNQIAYLKSGTVSMHKIDDGLVTITIKGPAIIGLGQMRGEKFTHYVRCNTNCELWVIDIDDASELFSKFSLWNHAFDIITKHLYMYFSRDNMIHKNSVKEIVLEHAKKIWGVDEGSRKSISIYSYILSRNNISRSAIHKAVSELIRDGVLNVNKGRVIDFKQSFDN